MRRIRPPDEEMARKVETVSREAGSVLPSTGYRSRSGVGMAGCGSQSLCWEVGVTREQRTVFQWIMGDILHGHP